MATAKPVPTTEELLAATSKIVTEPLNPHSVALNRGSNGVITIEVKTYGASTEDAMKSTREIFDKLAKAYPYQKLG